MNRLTRLTAILLQLQSKKILTAKEVASRYEISLRTVYRDMQALQEAGVPIGSENGVGYFLVEGYHLPPVALSEEEANALVISEQFIRLQGDTSLHKHFASLLDKLKATLKYKQKSRVQLLSERMWSYESQKSRASQHLSDIQRSLAHSVQVHIRYHSLGKAEETERSIEPKAIYFANKAWVVIAYCHLRAGLREFRVDRIRSLRFTDEAFISSPNFSLEKYFKAIQNS